MSHSVATRILDPIFTSKNRCEFRLDRDTLYSSDMRLINVGMQQDTADKKYNMLLGAEGVIQSIQLYDNNTMLSQILSATSWLAFSNLRKSNDSQLSRTGHLKKNALGFLAQGNQAYTNGDANNDSIVLTIQNDQSQMGGKAHISLRDVLPFLAAQAALPTNVFKRLRVVVEFKDSSELADLTNDGTQAGLSVETGLQLVVDELTGRANAEDMKQRESLMMNYKGVGWREVEHDAVHIAGTGLNADGSKVQEENFNISGFNNKSVRRLLLVNTPLDGYGAGSAQITRVADAGSNVIYGGEVQLRVNGQNLFPGSGVQGANRRLGKLTDAYGPIDCTVLGNQAGFINTNNISDPLYTAMGANIDYTGCRVDRRVEELQVSWSRTGAYGAADPNLYMNTALTLNMYGEVDKGVMMVGGGEYEVVYA